MAKPLSPLQWANSWLNKEPEPTMAFLATPLDQIDEHASMVAYVHGKYGAMLSNLEEAYEETRDARKRFYDRLILHVIEQVNPKTQQPYSVAYAERKVGENTKLQELIAKERKLKHKANKVKRFLRSLEMKGTNIPGKQGLFNRTFEMEDIGETKE